MASMMVGTVSKQKELISMLSMMVGRWGLAVLEIV